MSEQPIAWLYTGDDGSKELLLDCNGEYARRKLEMGWTEQPLYAAPAMTEQQTADEIVVTQEDAFWGKVERGDSEQCWPWLGGRGSTGGAYGRAHWQGRMRPATQVAWEITNGEPFPAGMLACHSCDNPICVNPDHIWPGTQSDNLRDCVQKGRHKAEPLTHCQRGHPLTGNNRRPTTGGYRCAECAREASKIRTRRWRERKAAQGD